LIMHRIESIIIFKATVSWFPGVQGSRFFNFRSFGKIQFALDAPCKESAQSKPASKCVCEKVHLIKTKGEISFGSGSYKHNLKH
jgi:hypothetical protein